MLKMLFEKDTTKTLAQIDESLRTAAASRKFGVLGVHNLREAMENKGVTFDKDCLVYEVCNPHQAKQVLEKNGGFSSLLPCRIAVLGEQGHYKLSTVLPTQLAQMFGDPALEPIAREVESAIRGIIEETAG